MKAKTVEEVITNSGKLKRNIRFKDVKNQLKYQSNSIGFHEPTQTWWGWSHRAAYGFGIGSKVKKGDCAYREDKGEWIAKDLNDAKKMAQDFADSVS